MTDIVKVVINSALFISLVISIMGLVLIKEMIKNEQTTKI
jgi:hypothetical protein